jgi:hypothetical protein
MKKLTLGLLFTLLLGLFSLPVLAQNATPPADQPPTIAAAEQFSVDGTVTITDIYAR